MTDRMPRTALVVAAAALGVQAAALIVARLLLGGTELPVIALFGERSVPLVGLDVTWGLVALFAGGAVAMAAGRSRAALLAGWSQGAGILVVLVARLDTLADASTLIAVFALAAGAVCVQIVDRDRDERTWRRPGAWAAAVGLVPWGVIAFGQIGSGLVGIGPGLGIRIVTLLALAVVAFGWWQAWRRPVPTSADVAVTTIGLSAVVWALAAVA